MIQDSGASFEQLMAFFENSDTYYLAKIDNEGNYAYMNSYFKSKYAHYFNTNGKIPAVIALHPDDYARSYETYINCCQNPGESFQVTLKKLNGRGGYIITQWDFKAELNQQGEVQGVIGIGYDITEFETRQKHISELTAALKDVAYKQSHLIRRPLANIMGLLQLAEGEQDADTLQAIMAMLKKSSADLEQEFNSFLVSNFTSTKENESEPALS